MATSGNRDLATRGNFFMARDSPVAQPRTATAPLPARVEQPPRPRPAGSHLLGAPSLLQYEPCAADRGAGHLAGAQARQGPAWGIPPV